MQKELILQLATAQEKLRAIDRLSNYIQKVNTKHEKDEIAYLIHQIIEADYLSSDLYRMVASWSIQASKDLFVTI